MRSRSERNWRGRFAPPALGCGRAMYRREPKACVEWIGCEGWLLRSLRSRRPAETADWHAGRAIINGVLGFGDNNCYRCAAHN